MGTAMNRPNTPALSALLFAAACAALPAAQAGEAKIKFVEPDKFTDIGRAQWDREEAMRALERHFQALAQTYIPADQQLLIDVTDVDLAGTQQPTLRHQDLRIVRRIDWPAMTLRYTLMQGDKMLKQGEERLVDMAFEDRIGLKYGNESYTYERRMLEDWFKVRFAKDVAKTTP
jgi:Cu/Ag efflux protein CusF